MSLTKPRYQTAQSGLPGNPLFWETVLHQSDVFAYNTANAGKGSLLGRSYGLLIRRTSNIFWWEPRKTLKIPMPSFPRGVQAPMPKLKISHRKKDGSSLSFSKSIAVRDGKSFRSPAARVARAAAPSKCCWRSSLFKKG